MEQITADVRVFAIDLAKHTFQVAGEDRRGTVVWEGCLKSREKFRTFLGTVKQGQLVLMEVGPGAQAWARELQSRGIAVRLLPAQRVAEHRSGAKNDRNDARAILRSGRDSAIHEVPIKSTQQLALQAVHRVRAGYVRRRTSVGNQIRGLLLEHGISIAKGDLALAGVLSRVVADASLPIPDLLRDLMAQLWAEWNHLGERLAVLTSELTTLAHQDPVARRLMTVRGIGPVGAGALVCKEIDPARYANARMFAASFGIVPDQHSTGGKTRLGKMSKRGDNYIRSVLIEGAQAVLAHVRLQPDASGEDRLHRWFRRHGRKGAAIRLANRNLRIVWRLLQDTTTYQETHA